MLALRIASGRKQPLPPSLMKAMPYTLPIYNRGKKIPPLVDYKSYAQEGYCRNSIVYACIRKIATTASAAYLTVNKQIDGKYENVSDHPLVAIFNRPNKFTSAFMFQEAVHTFLNLAGECYIVKVGFGGNSEMQELYLARPDRMHPVPGAKDLLGFTYIGEDGSRTPFLPDEVIHIKYPNPLDPFEGMGRGLPPLSAAAIEADVDNRATSFLKDFFDNGAVPYGLLKSKIMLEDGEIQRIRTRLKEQYSGERNWHEIMILDADAEYQRMGLGINEIAMPDLRRISESRICAVFSVPPMLIGVQIGLERSTFSNFGESRKVMWQDKIMPDNRRIAESLTSGFKEMLADDESVEHDYSDVAILQEDRNSQFDRADKGYKGGWLKKNEARLEAGFPEVEDGDVFIGASSKATEEDNAIN